MSHLHHTGQIHDIRITYP